MLKVSIRKGMLGEDGLEAITTDYTPDATPRQIVIRSANALPRGIELDVARNGVMCSEEDYDLPLDDGDHLIIVPRQSYGIDLYALIVYAVVSAVVSFAVNYAIQQLAPTPKPPDAPQERGDELSPVYSWDGITTSYGQGSTVGVVYGRHNVGGQVIYTTAQGYTEYQAPSVDKVALIIALSEGPIARIGDVGVDFNGYGGFSGGSPDPSVPGSTGSINPPVPAHITVNNNALATTSVLEGLNVFVLDPWLLQGNPTEPGLVIGEFIRTEQSPGVYHSHQIVFILNDTYVYCLPPTTSGFSPFVGQVVEAIGFFNPFPYPNTTLAGWSIDTPLTNPNPGVVAFGRMGSLGQFPLPSQSFPGIATTFTVNAQLEAFFEEFVFTFNDTEEVSSFSVVLNAPGGLYKQSNTGELAGLAVEFEYAWRFQGQAWQPIYNVNVGTTVDGYVVFRGTGSSQELQTVTGSFNPNTDPVAGPIELRIRRRSPTFGTGSVSTVVWRNVSFFRDQTLSYPRVALLGLELSAGARFNGGLPQVRARIDGVKVRVWDPVNLWSTDRFWDSITGPHNDGQWNFVLPGRSPAWVLVDYLTQPWGLGRYVSDDDLDMDSIYRWAVWCDQVAAPDWPEPKFLCDIVIDTPRPAWEWVVAICATGRASPIYRNGKIGVTYEYAKAHGNNKVTVPAKSPTQLIPGGTVENVQVTWLPRQNRATSINFQFLNEDLDHAQDVIAVEDPTSTANDPSELFPNVYRPETLQAYGVTRPSQLYREGIYRHAVGRGIAREISFLTGRWALAAEVGDVIEFEHELMRPFDENVPVSMHVVSGGLATTNVIVDHHLEGEIQYEIVVRDIEGQPQRADVSSFVNTTTNSQDVSVLTLVSPIDAEGGHPCVVGIKDKLVEEYQIISVTTQRDLKREVRCLQWVPEVHDEVTLAQYLDDGGAPGLVDDPGSPVSGNPGLFAQQLLDRRSMELRAVSDGTHAFEFVNTGSYRGSTARVYWRPSGSVDWRIAEQTEAFAVKLDHLEPHEPYEFIVAFESMDGSAPQPETLWPTTIEAPEFPSNAPNPMRGLSARATRDGVQVSWNESVAPGHVSYEVRAGTRWNGSRTIYSGKAASVLLEQAPLEGVVCVASKVRSGLVSEPVAVTLPAWPESKLYVDVTEVPGSPTGTHDGTQYSDDSLQLQAGEWEGVYTSPELDAGFAAPFVWRIAADIAEESLALCGESFVGCGSGEAAWSSLHGREASAGAPGVDWSRRCEDVDVALGDIPESWTCAGFIGEVGSHTRCLIESRFFVGASWTEWQEHSDQAVTGSSKAQFRLTLSTSSVKHEVRVLAVRYTAHLT